MTTTRRLLILTTAALLAGPAARAEEGGSYPPSAAYVGQWEYQAEGRTYRREFRADGTAEIWVNGKVFLHPSGKSWWMGMRWRYDEGLRAILILNSDRLINSIMQANPRNHDILRDVATGTNARRVPAGGEWGARAARPRDQPRASDPRRDTPPGRPARPEPAPAE
jgi:hypothetical protein